MNAESVYHASISAVSESVLLERLLLASLEFAVLAICVGVGISLFRVRTIFSPASWGTTP